MNIGEEAVRTTKIRLDRIAGILGAKSQYSGLVVSFLPHWATAAPKIGPWRQFVQTMRPWIPF